jgi:hypothetical protein
VIVVVAGFSLKYDIGWINDDDDLCHLTLIISFVAFCGWNGNVDRGLKESCWKHHRDIRHIMFYCTLSVNITRPFLLSRRL